jgi:mRNA-degrading endonuclease RelE of RelBE toxin-antitoxin system
MQYKVYLLPRARQEVDRLPGNIRQRARQTIIGLRDNDHPPHSKRLDYDVGPVHELWRVRLDHWRILYLIDREQESIYVLAARRRPPYQYEDLATLVSEVI